MPEKSITEQDFISRLTQIVEANLNNEQFGVEELAEKSGMSRSQLHRKLIRLKGKTAGSFIMEIRLSRAKELLEQSECTVAEIAYKVGFNSPSYFNKVFKKHFQNSPGEVRNEKKSNIEYKSEKGSLSNGRYKSVAVLTLIVLLAVILGVLGVRAFKGKTGVVEKSIAILPFDNLSSNENTQYFADGIVEDLLTRLSAIEDLKVISRTSSEMFRNKGNKTVPEIGEMLDVGYILEGSVQREEDEIRISIQLIHAETDNHVLSKQYDRSLNEIFKVQREIAREIASEIEPVLTEQQINKLEYNRTQNLEALKLYQLGRFYSNKRTTEDFKKGIEYYKQSIAEDPEFELAYAGLADNYHLMSLQGRMDKTEGNKLALEMANKALKIDANLAEAHTVLASIATFIERDWVNAEKEFKKALESNPNYSTVHQYYSEYLTIMGRDDEARYHIDQALKLDPFSFIIRFRSSRIYYDQEQFNEALTEIKVCLDLNHEHPWAIDLEYDIYLALEDDSAALGCWKKVGVMEKLWTPEFVDSIYQKEGIDGLTRWSISRDSEFVEEYHLAIFYAMLHEYEKTMDLLELAMDAGKLSPMRTTEREYKALRSNPRFIAIREKMGLPPLKP